MDVSSGTDIDSGGHVEQECATEDSESYQNQLRKIKNLEEKLKLLEEENCDLESQVLAADRKYEQQHQLFIARYMNAEFTLAQMQYMLPMKRTRLGKHVSSNTDVIPSNDYLILKHFLNPTTNLVYRKMHEMTKETQTKVRQSNDDLLAWKFTPKNSIGRRLMSRIRHLLSANEELGKANETDRIRTLESELELQTTCMKEFIKTNEEIEAVSQEAYADLEGLQTSLLGLNQQIKQTESVVQVLQNEIEALQPGRVTEIMAELLVKMSAEGHEESQFQPEELVLDESNEVVEQEHENDGIGVQPSDDELTINEVVIESDMQD